MRGRTGFTLAVALIAGNGCGNSGSTGSSTVDASRMPGDASTPTADASTPTGDASTPAIDGSGARVDAAVAAVDGASASNSISGSVNGKPFTAAVTTLRIGSPDDPASTVVYVFDHTVSCSEITTMGWDGRITNGTQVLELKMLGMTARSYTVTSSATPAAGEASVNYTLSSTSGTPSESIAASGTVALGAAVAGNGGARGSFDVTFPNGHVTGSFDAAFCPGGSEP